MRQAAEKETQQPSAVISQDPEDQNFEALYYPEAQISRPIHNTGWLKYVVNFVLGDHHSEPIWRLRLLASFIFVSLAMFGSFFLPIYLHELHGTYQIVVTITIVGALVGFAAISLFLSFWLPSERTNWITGLLVGNICLFVSAIGVYYLALQNGTGR